MNPRSKKWIVYVSTFPPRECGIATFTQDLMTAFDEMYNPREEAKVVAMNRDEIIHYMYDQKKVIYEIPQPSEHKYAEAARYLNSRPEVALVHVQHEFGIYGGEQGEYIIQFLRELEKPAVVTFHTVLPSPGAKMKEVTQSISNHVQKVIVMTHASKQILIDEYGIDHEKISVIPHGVHPVKYGDGALSRKELSLEGRTIIATFGLLSPGKGIEFGIEAMRAVAKKHPDTLYLIIGATHPNILREFGEEYRNTLIKKVHDYGLEKNVFFYDKYLDLNELLKFLDAAHIYVALSQNPNQAVSGTLSYALGSGRAVISTAFSQAKEEVTPEVGKLIGFQSTEGLAEAILELIDHPDMRSAMAKRAYFMTRDRTWQNVMLRHMAEYMHLIPALGSEEENLPKLKLDHMFTMTDHFGMYQFATMTKPDPAHGYTTDDNARALVAAVKYYKTYRKKRVLPLIQTYLEFLDYVQIIVGGFHNYVDSERRIPMDQHLRDNLETSSARALHALAVTAASHPLPEQFRKMAERLFRKHMHVMEHFEFVRSIAMQIKALCEWHKFKPSEEIASEIRRHAARLVEMFEKTNAPDWKWFENELTYANGMMPDALVDAYQATKNERYLTVARETLDFLIMHSFEGEMCMPIGQNGWFKRGGTKAKYDQQPEEVSYMVSALKSMYAATRDPKYLIRMRQAFSWFLGHNALRRTVYDDYSGGCYDGVSNRDININEGAESTVMYLLARLEFENENSYSVNGVGSGILKPE